MDLNETDDKALGEYCSLTHTVKDGLVQVTPNHMSTYYVDAACCKLRNRCDF